MIKTLRTLFIAVSLCWSTASFAAVELAGVKVEDSISIAGTTLQLNGAGIRYKGPLQGLRRRPLHHPARQVPRRTDCGPGPKRLTMTFLREINSADFGKLLTRGIEDNVSRNEISKIIPGMIKMGDIFCGQQSLRARRRVCPGMGPRQGSEHLGQGQAAGRAFKDPAFFRALMSIWFGHTRPTGNSRTKCWGSSNPARTRCHQPDSI